MCDEAGAWVMRRGYVSGGRGRGVADAVCQFVSMGALLRSGVGLLRWEVVLVT